MVRPKFSPRSSPPARPATSPHPGAAPAARPAFAPREAAAPPGRNPPPAHLRSNAPERRPEAGQPGERRGGKSWADKPKAPEKILFQSFFKSVGPRTYAAQVKESPNGNHALVLIEGKRDDATGELKKHKLYLWSEDFPAFMEMFGAVRNFIADNPVPEAVRAKREAFWKKGGKFLGRARPAAAKA